ncbi:MAG TPA: cyclic nucleotide-binding domain-containing protein [Thermodesulfobacteriota bacterium]|jgi:CRP-like cAMP-binding protein|nr:cyclic nucleotide-binding domain-containing protein [Thermodesulfobacteriota bacterium]
MKKQFDAGFKKILFPLHKARDFLDASGLARMMFSPPTGKAAGERGRDLVDFLKQVSLFEDLAHGDLRRLARIVHERSYRDGEVICEEGKPGAAMYLLRGGIVEIARRKRNGEEVPLVMLEPPASFAELAAVGAEVVNAFSARARGPVSLVAIGHSDLDALSHSFPPLANKILKKLAQIFAVRLQILLEAEYFNEERSLNGDSPQ